MPYDIKITVVDWLLRWGEKAHYIIFFFNHFDAHLKFTFYFFSKVYISMYFFHYVHIQIFFFFCSNILFGRHLLILRRFNTIRKQLKIICIISSGYLEWTSLSFCVSLLEYQERTEWQLRAIKFIWFNSYTFLWTLLF